MLSPENVASHSAFGLGEAGDLATREGVAGAGEVQEAAGLVQVFADARLDELALGGREPKAEGGLGVVDEGPGCWNQQVV